MPSKYYKRVLRSSNYTAKYISTYLPTLKSNAVVSPIYIVKPITINGTCKDVFFYKQIEDALFAIIDAITNQIELSKIIEDIKSVQELFRSREEALELLENIQCSILGIFHNISDGVSLELVNNRIKYLQEIITSADPSTFPVICSDVVSGIEEILDMFASATDFNQIIQNLTTIHDSMTNDIGKADLFEDAQCATLGIIQNITNGVDLNIVNNRITYLQELVRQIQVLGLA